MDGIGLGSLQSFHAHRVREAVRPPSSGDCHGARPACDAPESAPDTQRQAAYQSVVLVLREKFSVSSQGAAPVAGLTPAEQADNQLAATVGAALNSSADVPAEQVGASVEEGLQQALGTAAGDAIDIATEIRRRVQSLVSAFVAARAEGSVQATSAKVTTRERGVLEIHTLEGDVVKIDFRHSTSVRLGSLEGPEGSQDSLKVRISERTSLQVEGDLSQAELAAIGDLVAKVDTLANEFFAGDVEQAFAAAQDLQLDTSQLADYSLKLSMTQKVRIHALTVPALTADLQPEAAPVPAASAETVASPQTEVPAIEETAAPSVDTSRDVPSDPAPVATAPASPASEPMQAATVQQIIGTFVARLRASFAMSATESGLGISSSVKLSLLAAAIEAHPQSTSATPDATAALKDVATEAGVTQ
jgi:hypothetical protein